MLAHPSKKDFKINDYLTLKLEGGRTIIYVKNQPFRQCMYLLLDIPIQDIERFVKDLEFDTFSKNREKIFAVVYCLQVIGEAVKNIPDTIISEYTNVPWREIAGMRDRLIHRYFTVDVKRVWQTIQRDLPPLEISISKILKEQ